MTAYYCEQCGEAHKVKCPKLSAKRRKQVREAQARHRAKKAEEKAEATADKATIAELRAKVRRLESENCALRNRPSAMDLIEGTEKGYRRFMQFIHPDKHGQHPVAVRLAKMANELRQSL